MFSLTWQTKHIFWSFRNHLNISYFHLLVRFQHRKVLGWFPEHSGLRDDIYLFAPEWPPKMISFVWPACVNWHKDVLSGVHQGMGGQHGYFGLWLDSDFGRGHSRARPKCTTYGSPQLSGDEDFTLDSMEVWAVGKPPEPEEVRVLVQILL